MDADEKIDLQDAILSSVLITSSLAFALGSIYFLAYIGLLDLAILGNIPFLFVLFSLLITFNFVLCYNLIDQLLS